MKSIAWDFDGVLFDFDQNHILLDFIHSNQNISHHIVTHRSHGLEKNIQYDLKENGSSLKFFKSIHSVPYHYYEEHCIGEEHNYRTWKCWICKTLGIQFLVDDKPELSVTGSKRFGIPIILPEQMIKRIQRCSVDDIKNEKGTKLLP